MIHQCLATRGWSWSPTSTPSYCGHHGHLYMSLGRSNLRDDYLEVRYRQSRSNGIEAWWPTLSNHLPEMCPVPPAERCRPRCSLAPSLRGVETHSVDLDFGRLRLVFRCVVGLLPSSPAAMIHGCPKPLLRSPAELGLISTCLQALRRLHAHRSQDMKRVSKSKPNFPATGPLPPAKMFILCRLSLTTSCSLVSSILPPDFLILDLCLLTLSTVLFHSTFGLRYTLSRPVSSSSFSIVLIAEHVGSCSMVDSPSRWQLRLQHIHLGRFLPLPRPSSLTSSNDRGQYFPVHPFSF